ncbi:MAG: hypothetical protein PHY62_04980 [Gallionella sp.]|nr:hypothetical protein [Gallionella sp.]
MSGIQDFFQQAQLVEAAYSNFVDPQTNSPYTEASKIQGVLKTGTFSPARATAIAQQWRVVDHLPNTISGTSMTLFQSTLTGAYHLAARGTEPLVQGGVDFLQADMQKILQDGLAINQIIDTQNQKAQLCI